MSGQLKTQLAEARASGDWQRLVDAVPYARHLGVRAEATEEELLLHLPFKESLVGNPDLQALHGGVLGAFLETAAILTLLWRLESPVVPKTITNTVDYLRSARGLDIHASGEVTRLGRRVASVAVSCWSAERRKPLATARLHFLVGGGEAP
ncbi:PaaI family thioesterase [Limibacillus halophilus]